MIRVSIIENDKFLCETLQVVLHAREVVDVVSIYLNGEDALKELPLINPDIVLVDIDLGASRMNGIECITRLKPLMPKAQFMILTIFDEYQKVFDAMSAGALGYVLKSDKPDKIIMAIQELYEGGSPMTPSIARKVALTFNREQSPNHGQADILTSREREVLELISKGRIEKEVAAELFISYKTVKTHISNIYTKLQVNTRVEALNKYFGR